MPLRWKNWRSRYRRRYRHILPSGFTLSPLLPILPDIRRRESATRAGKSD